MRYLFLLWGDEAAELALTARAAAIVAAHGAFLRGLVAAGRSVTGEPLGPARDGIVVGQRRPSPTDGPYLETKEQIGGFYLIECADRDDAIEVARAIPGAPGWRSRSARSRIELRERARIDRADPARLRWTPRPGSEVDLPGDLLLPLFIVTLIANALLVAAAIRSLRHDPSRSGRTDLGRPTPPVDRRLDVGSFGGSDACRPASGRGAVGPAGRAAGSADVPPVPSDAPPLAIDPPPVAADAAPVAIDPPSNPPLTTSRRGTSGSRRRPRPPLRRRTSPRRDRSSAVGQPPPSGSSRPQPSRPPRSIRPTRRRRASQARPP